MNAASADENTSDVDTKADKVLKHDYQVQETGYWCSAASARIALSCRGVAVSQGTLADAMGVTPDVGLPDIANLQNTMNHYNSAGYKVKQWSSESELLTQLKADVKHNIDGGYAAILNVVRIGSAEFPGGHYAPIVGYRNDLAELLIADPSSSSRQTTWLPATDVANGVKLFRYVA